MIEQPLKFLVVEDLVSDTFLFQRMLKKVSKNPDVRFSDSILSLQNALKTYIPDFIISDFNLTGFNAFDVINTVKDINQNIPIIIISGKLGNDERVANLLMEGAAGFFNKDNFQELPEKIIPVCEKILQEKKDTFDKLERERKRESSLKEMASFLRQYDLKETTKERSLLQELKKNFSGLLNMDDK